ncbi:MAG TPA: enoyl-CoA hydratase-related protein [Armatimonadota bacterium]
MNEDTRIETALDARGVMTLTLNRPAERNALDGQSVSELMRNLEAAGANSSVKVVVLRGAGPVFSDGTDMRWLDHMSEASYADNLRDAKSLATMLDSLDGFAKPVVAAVHGAVIGDALGLVAACDVVVASADTTFQAPELSYGLVPACVAPFLIAKIGGSHARNILLTGRPFDAARAKEIRLVHDVVATRSQLDGAVEAAVIGMLRGAPHAHKQTKALIRRLTYHGHSLLSSDTLDDVATCLAKSRSSEDVCEGLDAMSKGRPPKWAPKPAE